MCTAIPHGNIEIWHDFINFGHIFFIVFHLRMQNAIFQPHRPTIHHNYTIFCYALSISFTIFHKISSIKNPYRKNLKFVLTFFIDML